MKTFIVGAVGVEPTCDQLPFLHLIRVRGYAPLFVRPPTLADCADGFETIIPPFYKAVFP